MNAARRTDDQVATPLDRTLRLAQRRAVRRLRQAVRS
jgi:hypothetical protein